MVHCQVCQPHTEVRGESLSSEQYPSEAGSAPQRNHATLPACWRWAHWDAAPATTVCPSSLRRATKPDPQASTLKKVRTYLSDTSRESYGCCSQPSPARGGSADQRAGSQCQLNHRLGSHGLLLGCKCYRGFQEGSGWNASTTAVKPRHLDCPDFKGTAGRTSWLHLHYNALHAK